MSVFDPYRVVVFATPDDPHALRDILVEKLKLHPTDAQLQVHAAPGLLTEHFTREQAEQLAEVIRAAGISAAALPESDVPDFERVEMVHHARCLDAGLEIIDVRGDSESVIPWNHIELISIGNVPIEHVRHYDVDSIRFHSAPRAGHHTVEADVTGPEAWIVRRDPFRPYLIDHKRMNYEDLGARKTGSATHNFRLFVEEVVRHAPQTYLTPATRAFLEHGLLRHYQFHSEGELRGYTTFHLLLRRQMRTSGA